MLNIGGELAFLLQDIDYNSKDELIDKLKALQKDIKTYPKEEKAQIGPILSVSVQQAMHLSEWELMRYKNYCKYRSEHYEKNKNVD